MGEHYFSGAPNVPSRPHVVRFRIDGHDVALASDRGVFSAERLDPGTGVLLRAVPSSAGRSLLDLGCGYGPITCVLAERNPAATIWAIDVNARARALTEQNVAAAGYADQVRVCAPEEVPPDVSFDEIWSNPPVRIVRTYSPKPGDITRQWHVIDATDVVLGRLADARLPPCCAASTSRPSPRTSTPVTSSSSSTPTRSR
jgi:16S rRNA G1207 methylase RsmC